MSEIKSNKIKVNGASLYYEVSGSGPILLLISGGCGDAGTHSRLVNFLIDQYTVVTYDRRGYTRSKLEDPAQEIRLEIESEDLHQLLSALGSEPAYVLGSSIGAVIALDLVSRYPEQIHTLIAHEPPAHYLTSSNKDILQKPLSESIQEILEHNDVNIAMRTFATMVGLSGPEIAMVQNADNAIFFIQKEAPMLNNYRFDFNVLKSAMTRARIIIGGGSTSPRDSIGYLGAVALSEHLGIFPVIFPGDHDGMGRNPEQFAKRLCEVLGD